MEAAVAGGGLVPDLPAGPLRRGESGFAQAEAGVVIREAARAGEAAARTSSAGRSRAARPLRGVAGARKPRAGGPRARAGREGPGRWRQYAAHGASAFQSVFRYSRSASLSDRGGSCRGGARRFRSHAPASRAGSRRAPPLTLTHEPDPGGIEQVVATEEDGRPSLRRLQEIAQGGHGAVVEIGRRGARSRAGAPPRSRSSSKARCARCPSSSTVLVGHVGACLRPGVEPLAIGADLRDVHYRPRARAARLAHGSPRSAAAKTWACRGLTAPSRPWRAGRREEAGRRR